MARRPERAERGAIRLDPRLLIGIVLIAASTAGVWALVSGFDDSVEVYAVRGTVTPGTPIDAADLTTQSVRLGAAAERYLAPGDLPDGGLVAIRTMEAGELVPASAVDTVDSTGLATVVVPSRNALPSGLGPGATVDLWAARLVDRGSYEPPVVLVAGAEIAGIQEPEGMVASGGVSVELLVPREKVAALLEALASGDALDLVPARAGSD
ncbi:MAG TPA: SAF domain-containing protein [Agromyces sp.]|nr:SAF domain-containing protein [Agromyces sp.]